MHGVLGGKVTSLSRTGVISSETVGADPESNETGQRLQGNNRKSPGQALGRHRRKSDDDEDEVLTVVCINNCRSVFC